MKGPSPKGESSWNGAIMRQRGGISKRNGAISPRKAAFSTAFIRNTLVLSPATKNSFTYNTKDFHRIAYKRRNLSEFIKSLIKPWRTGRNVQNFDKINKIYRIYLNYLILFIVIFYRRDAKLQRFLSEFKEFILVFLHVPARSTRLKLGSKFGGQTLRSPIKSGGTVHLALSADKALCEND